MASARDFAALDPPLLPSTLAVLARLGFKRMTPVQAATLPLFLGHKDVAVEACTGSGKTLAFAIPIVERLLRLEPALRPHQIGAIVIAPTRELAAQTLDVVRAFAEGTPLSAALLVGGTDAVGELERCAARGCNVVVATPGRLLDVLRRNAAGAGGGGAVLLDVRALEVLVLDEADTLLDMGFADTLGGILAALPKQRRTGLFSATQTREVKALARAGMRNPAVVRVAVQLRAGAGAASAPGGGAAEPAAAGDVGDTAAPAQPQQQQQATPLSLTNYVTLVDDAYAKLLQLTAFLRGAAAARHKAIVFALTCAAVDYYGRAFADPAVRAAAGLPPADGFPILPLHGKMAPKRRVATFAAFVGRRGGGALLCTDVAARGLDVPDVDWIVQYDAPKDPAFFVHRVGRTARAGRRGASLLLLLKCEADYVQLLGLRHVPIAARDAAPELPAPALPPAPAAASVDAAAPPASRKRKRAAGDAPDAGALVATHDAVAAAAVEAGEAALAPRFRGLVGRADDPPRLALGRALQRAALRDRDLLEKGSTAFLAHLRGYSEHLLKTIFRPAVATLSPPAASALALSFGLVKLPKADELRGAAAAAAPAAASGGKMQRRDARGGGAAAAPSAGAAPGATGVAYAFAVTGFATHEVAFADAAREAARQARLVAAEADAAAERAARDERRRRALATTARADKAAATAAADAAAGRAAAGGAGRKAKRVHKGTHARMQEEWALLAREERLEKRLKAGTLGAAEYAAEMAVLNAELGFEDEDGLVGAALAAAGGAGPTGAGAADGGGDAVAAAAAAAAPGGAAAARHAGGAARPDHGGPGRGNSHGRHGVVKGSRGPVHRH